MLNIIVWDNIPAAEQNAVLQRPEFVDTGYDVQNKVRDIIQQVRKYGDSALRELNLLYDKVDLCNFAVSEQEFSAARRLLPESRLAAMRQAIQNLTIFHQAQKPQNYKITTAPGIVCEYRSTAIEKVGLYIPAGSAPLVSTVFMLGVPAQIANCPTRILCTPPSKDGTVNPNILVAAQLCGINKVYKIGGAQAIAALAYGTETVPKVAKIFGPGNNWVTTAKLQVAHDPAGAVCDMPAGPSEVLVIADENANASFVAADLLAQAEHGPDSQVVLITTSMNFAAAVNLELQQQLKTLSRKTIVDAALKNSRCIVVDKIATAIEISNRYAPEHLILQVNNPRDYISEIINAGAVFLGQWSPESAGDYCSGTNHVLPTYGFARSVSGLSVNDFMRSTTYQQLTLEGLTNIATTIAELSGIEGLDAHNAAVAVRLSGDYSNAK